MNRMILTISLLCSFRSVLAFSDTTWLNGKWRACPQGDAVYFSVTERHATLWQQHMYRLDNNFLYMEGDFLDATCTVKTGQFKWYDQNGILLLTRIYQQGKPLEITHFHPNGKIKTLLLYNAAGKTTYVNSWNELGIETVSDTFYHDMQGHECHKDTAFFQGIINKQDSSWHLRFFTMDHVLMSDAFYKERLCKTRTGSSRSYYFAGGIRDSAVYDSLGRIEMKLHYHPTGVKDMLYHFSAQRTTSILYFHENGNRNFFKKVDSAGHTISSQNWDEAGNETGSDTARILPQPPGGMKEWKKKMIHKINSDNTLEKKVKKNFYGTVYLTFFVLPDGSGDSVRILTHSTFKEMDNAILQACSSSTTWSPGKNHGRRERFALTFYFSFVAGKVIDYHPSF